MPCNKKLIFFVVCAICLSFFSCGLDVFYFLEPPFNSTIPSPDNPPYNIYSFTSAHIINLQQEHTGEITYLRTDNSYRIYYTLSILNSHISSLTSVNT